MNNTSESGKRGIFKPSARKSIHSHNNCPFIYTEMGRYGMNKLKNRVNTSCNANTSLQPNHEHETDEPDCAASKGAPPESLLLNENTKDAHRRNSLNFSHEKSLEEISEDEDMVAKSLPAELPSYLHYRDQQYNGMHDHRNMTRQSYKRNPNINYENTFVYESASKKSLQRQELRSSTYNGMINKILMSTSFIVIIIGFLGVYLYPSFYIVSEEDKNIYDEWKFYHDLNVLKNKYKIHDNSVLLVQSGISTIFEKEDTGCFVIIYNSKNNNFNQLGFHNFVNDVASTAARYLRNDTAPNQHIEVDSSNLHMHSHSELINKYRHDVIKSGVMLVRELDRVPSHLAMAFHYYCDEYNPLAKKSAIFFTLNMENCSDSSGQKSTHAFIEKCLSKKWHSVPHDNVGPLLTRVVSVVVDVTNAF